MVNLKARCVGGGLKLNSTSFHQALWILISFRKPHDQTEANSTHSPVHHIQTCSSMLAGWTVTLVDVQLTVDALVSRHTLTGVQSHVIMAGGAVLTGICLTFINVNFTVNSCRTNQHTDSLTEETSQCSPLKTDAAWLCWIHCCIIYVALPYLEYIGIWIW